MDRRSFGRETHGHWSAGRLFSLPDVVVHRERIDCDGQMLRVHDDEILTPGIVSEDRK